MSRIIDPNTGKPVQQQAITATDLRKLQGLIPHRQEMDEPTQDCNYCGETVPTAVMAQLPHDMNKCVWCKVEEEAQRLPDPESKSELFRRVHLGLTEYLEVIGLLDIDDDTSIDALKAESEEEGEEEESPDLVTPDES